MNEQGRRRIAFARLLSNAVLSQGILSAASFAVGLILIRNTSDIQYGYYIMALNALLLLASLQNAFFNPPLSIRIHRLDRLGRGELVGGLYREQRRLLPALGAITVMITLGLWYSEVLDNHTAPLILTTIMAALAILHREYFRMVLFVHRRPHDILRSDIFYVVLLVIGVFMAIFTPVPAITAVMSMCIAAIASGILLSHTLHHHEPWNLQGSKGILREIAPLALWSTSGAAIHWTFSQGYIYLVAGTLDVTAVAALAATRLLLMPMNLLSTGIGSLMLPLAAGWLRQYGSRLLWRRLCLFALGLGVVTLCYFAVLWTLRDWIFTVVLKKQFAQRDALLMLWGMIVLVIIIRGQLDYLLSAQGRYRVKTLLTLVCAVIALVVSYWGMLQFGVAGALLGILLGEVVNMIGTVIISYHGMRQPHPPSPADVIPT